MTGENRLNQFKNRLATMPEEEAKLRLRIYQYIIDQGASESFAGMCAFGCSSDRLLAFAAEVLKTVGDV